MLTAVISSMLITEMVIANSFLASKKTLSATDEAVSAVSSFYLGTIVERRAKIVINQIDHEFSQMEKALSFIKDEEIKSQEDLRDTLGRIKDLLSLNRFALADKDNIVYTQYTTYTGRSRHEFLSRKEMDDRVITTVSPYGSSKQLCLAISTPDLEILDRTFKACFVQIDIRDIVELLALDDEQDRTYFAVYLKNGGNLSETELGPVILGRNIFDALKDVIPKEDLEETRTNFETGKKGSLSFASGEDKETMYYVPIPGTGWELAVLIHESVILDQIRGIGEKNISTSRNQILFAVVASLLLFIVLLLEYRALSRQKLEAEKETSKAFQNMANTDSMTGIRNKHAYSAQEEVLDQKIQNHEILNLAVVVCDINGLKHVNDTQGHTAGDKLIKDACSLICEYFSHGAVFRTGGDEFVVLLQGKGYDERMEVIEAFNRKIEENIKENGVVVSIGCAVLENEDLRLSDVFERADQKMYERKKELKSMGVKTRYL